MGFIIWSSIFLMSVAVCLAVPTRLAKETCQPTAKDIEGPYYKANAPFQPQGRDIPAVCKNTPAYDRLYLNGTIKLQKTDGDCSTPVKALLDIWQANADGVYSDHTPGSKDYSCRSRMYTRDDGSYSLSSIFPGRYDDGGYRPAHIHFKITPVDKYNKPIGRTLTAQLYFAEDYYLSPVDSCGRCNSGASSLISHVQHISDIKTYVGSWDVVLDASTFSLKNSAEEEQPITSYHA